MNADMLNRGTEDPPPSLSLPLSLSLSLSLFSSGSATGGGVEKKDCNTICAKKYKKTCRI